MLKKRDKRKLEIKKKEWDIAVSSFDRFVKRMQKTVIREYGNMINFLFFFKPQDKWDRSIHLFEMVCIYIVLQYAWIGMFWR